MINESILNVSYLIFSYQNESVIETQKNPIVASELLIF